MPSRMAHHCRRFYARKLGSTHSGGKWPSSQSSSSSQGCSTASVHLQPLLSRAPRIRWSILDLNTKSGSIAMINQEQLRDVEQRFVVTGLPLQLMRMHDRMGLSDQMVLLLRSHVLEAFHQVTALTRYQKCSIKWDGPRGAGKSASLLQLALLLYLSSKKFLFVGNARRMTEGYYPYYPHHLMDGTLVYEQPELANEILDKILPIIDKTGDLSEMRIKSNPVETLHKTLSMINDSKSVIFIVDQWNVFREGKRKTEYRDAQGTLISMNRMPVLNSLYETILNSPHVLATSYTLPNLHADAQDHLSRESLIPTRLDRIECATLLDLLYRRLRLVMPPVNDILSKTIKGNTSPLSTLPSPAMQWVERFRFISGGLPGALWEAVTHESIHGSRLKCMFKPSETLEIDFDREGLEDEEIRDRLLGQQDEYDINENNDSDDTDLSWGGQSITNPLSLTD